MAWWGNDEGLGLGRWGEQPSVRAVGQSGGRGGGFRVWGFWGGGSSMADGYRGKVAGGGSLTVMAVRLVAWKRS